MAKSDGSLIGVSRDHNTDDTVEIMSSELAINSKCSVSKWSDTSFAIVASLKPVSKPIEKVLRGAGFVFLMSAQIIEESKPPERNAPTGTSAIIRVATALVNSSSNASMASDSSTTVVVQAFGYVQNGRGSVLSEGEEMRIQVPIGSGCMSLNRVSLPGRNRYVTHSAILSSSISRGASVWVSSDFISEPNRKTL